MNRWFHVFNQPVMNLTLPHSLGVASFRYFEFVSTSLRIKSAIATENVCPGVFCDAQTVLQSCGRLAVASKKTWRLKGADISYRVRWVGSSGKCRSCVNNFQMSHRYFCDTWKTTTVSKFDRFWSFLDGCCICWYVHPYQWQWGLYHQRLVQTQHDGGRCHPGCQTHPYLSNDKLQCSDRRNNCHEVLKSTRRIRQTVTVIYVEINHCLKVRFHYL